MNHIHIFLENQSIRFNIGSQERVFVKHVLKAYLSQISKLYDENNESLFEEIETKALKNYFLKLLAKKDYLSKKLKEKALMAGFLESLIDQLIADFIEKGWLNDQKVMDRMALRKIKQGYAASRFAKSIVSTTEAAELEQTSLKKLIRKKHHLLTSSEIKQRQKGYRFFLSRGYSINQINDQLKSLELFHD